MDDEAHSEVSSNPKPVPPPKPNPAIFVMTRKLDDLTEKFTQLEEKLHRDQRISHDKISLLQTGFNAMQKDYFTLREQHGKLKTENCKPLQEMAELKAYLEAFQEDHRDVLTEHKKLKTEQEKLNTEQEKLKNEQEKLNTEQEKLKTEQEKLKTEQEKLKTEQEKLKPEQEKLKTEMHTMRSDQQTQASDVEKFREEQNDILKEVTSVRKEMTMLSQDLTNIKEASITQHCTDLPNLSQLNETNQDKLYEQFTKIEEDHSKLVKKQISLQKEVTDLQMNQGNLSTDVDSITAVQRTLNSDLTRLQSENVDPVLAEQGRLQEKQATLTSDVVMLKADVDQVKTSLQQSLVTQSSAIAALETRLGQVQSPQAPLPPPNPTTTPSFPPSVDMKKAKPRRLFTSSPSAVGDWGAPWITTIVCLSDDRLLMTDLNNNKVKVMEVSSPQAVTASLAVAEGPRRLAVLPDGMVAMTTLQSIIYLMTVTDTVTVTSRVQTDRVYVGIAGHGGGHLIVSCQKSSTCPAAVNVMTRKGDLVRTICDGSRLPGLESPYYLFDTGDNHVLASDWDAHKVFMVNVTFGQVTLTHQHTDMRWPAQVCSDSAGQLYVASSGRGCVLVRNRKGQWRKLLIARQHGDKECDSSWALCLTRSGHLVVSWYKGDFSSVVICYQLS